MSVDEVFDVPDEERERRKGEADLTYRLILAARRFDRALSETEVDPLLGL